MQIRLVTVAGVAILALVSGCAAEQPQTVASAASRCRDPRFMQTCFRVDSTGEVATDEEAASTAGSTKGKFAGKSEMDRRALAFVMRPRVPTPPPPIPEPPHGPEPKSAHPPPPHH